MSNTPNLLNPTGLDPIGGAFGNALMKIDPVGRYVNGRIFGSGGPSFRQREGVHATSFRNVAEPQAQSAYNAPDAVSRMSTPAGQSTGGSMSPFTNRGNPGISPMQNASATMGMANPSYGMNAPGLPRMPSQPGPRNAGFMPPSFGQAPSTRPMMPAGGPMYGGQMPGRQMGGMGQGFGKQPNPQPMDTYMNGEFIPGRGLGQMGGPTAMGMMGGGFGSGPVEGSRPTRPPASNPFPGMPPRTQAPQPARPGMGGGFPTGPVGHGWFGDAMRGVFGESTGDYARRMNNRGDIAG